MREQLMAKTYSHNFLLRLTTTKHTLVPEIILLISISRSIQPEDSMTEPLLDDFSNAITRTDSSKAGTVSLQLTRGCWGDEVAELTYDISHFSRHPFYAVPQFKRG